MNLDVYDVDNATYVDTLSEAHGISFMVDVRVPGALSFTVDLASTADLALLEPRRVVRLRTGGSPGTGDILAGVVQDRPADLAVDDERPAVRVECPGLLDWLGYQQGGAVLAPYGAGPDLASVEGRQQNPRMFGWMAQDFDDSGWGPVDGPSMLGGPLSTEGWPDDRAVAFEPIFPGQRARYRRLLEAVDGEGGPARMFLAATWGSEVTVWLDNDVVLEKEAGKTGLFYVDVPYEDIDHQLAVEVVGGTGRWGWTWMRLVEDVDENGNEILRPGAALRRTYDPSEFTGETPWLSYEGDLPYPGVTVGYVMDVAVSESQARGEIPNVSYDFTPALDSSGSAWSKVFTRGFRMQKLGRLLDSLAAFKCEPEMTPDGMLRLFEKRGQDLTASVTVTAPFALSLSGRGVQATRLLYETEGGFGWGRNQAAETGWGVVLADVGQFGEDIDPDSLADAVADQLIADGQLRDEIDIDLPDDVVPYVDVEPGDVVTAVSTLDGSTGPVRLMSFTGVVDDATGFTEWSAVGVPDE